MVQLEGIQRTTFVDAMDGEIKEGDRMVSTLKSRKEVLECKLREKTSELKKICVQEAELTGVLPPETPLELGESPPHFRRRIGTSFAYPESLLDKLKGKEVESLAALELELKIQTSIAEAALGLANDGSASKSLRRNHRNMYQQSQRRLAELEAKLVMLRAAQGQQVKHRKKPRPVEGGGDQTDGKSRNERGEWHQRSCNTSRAEWRNTAPIGFFSNQCYDTNFARMKYQYGSLDRSSRSNSSCEARHQAPPSPSYSAKARPNVALLPNQIYPENSLMRTRSLGNVEPVRSSKNLDTQSLSINAEYRCSTLGRKSKEKEWRETSLDGVPKVRKTPPLLHPRHAPKEVPQRPASRHYSPPPPLPPPKTDHFQTPNPYDFPSNQQHAYMGDSSIRKREFVVAEQARFQDAIIGRFIPLEADLRYESRFVNVEISSRLPAEDCSRYKTDYQDKSGYESKPDLNPSKIEQQEPEEDFSMYKTGYIDLSAYKTDYQDVPGYKIGYQDISGYESRSDTNSSKMKPPPPQLETAAVPFPLHKPTCFPSKLYNSYTESPLTSPIKSPDSIVPLESPKNHTVVEVGKWQPYREVTKPFEMSDFYKYSQKFRKNNASVCSVDSTSCASPAQATSNGIVRNGANAPPIRAQRARTPQTTFAHMERIVEQVPFQEDAKIGEEVSNYLW